MSQDVAKKDYKTKIEPATLLPKELGNMYCASLYAGLATLVHNKASSLVITFAFSSPLHEVWDTHAECKDELHSYRYASFH